MSLDNVINFMRIKRERGKKASYEHDKAFVMSLILKIEEINRGSDTRREALDVICGTVRKYYEYYDQVIEKDPYNVLATSLIANISTSLDPDTVSLLMYNSIPVEGEITTEDLPAFMLNSFTSFFSETPARFPIFLGMQALYERIENDTNSYFDDGVKYIPELANLFIWSLEALNRNGMKPISYRETDGVITVGMGKEHEVLEVSLDLKHLKWTADVAEKRYFEGLSHIDREEAAAIGEKVLADWEHMNSSPKETN